MLNPQQSLLPDNQQKSIHQLLNSQPAHDLLQWLNGQAAEYAVLAINKRIQEKDITEADKLEAEELEEKARFCRKMVDKLLEISKPDFVFKTITVKPIALELTIQPPI